MHEFYWSIEWKRARLRVLERDDWLCQVHGPTCTHVATAVDHIVRPEDGGSKYDESNLRGVCRNCNNWRAAKTRKRLRAAQAGYSNPRW